MSWKLVSFVGVVLCAGALADSPFDAERPYLEKLGKKSEINVADFQYPFLISQTAALSSLSTNEAWARVEQHLRGTVLDLPPHGASRPLASAPDYQVIRFPEVVTTGDQLEAIEKCRVKKCNMKLNDSEKPLVEKASDKTAEYLRLVRERVHAYVADNKLVGYEERPSNEPFVRKMIGTWPFLAVKYPEVAKYFSDEFWKKAQPPKTFRGSFLKQEVLSFGMARLQPIYRISEVFSFDASPAKVAFEMHVYSDHYFDSSMRLWEVQPVGEKSRVIVTDIMEIDELTKSDFARFLYEAQMESALRRFQHEELGGIAGLVSLRSQQRAGRARHARHAR